MFLCFALESSLCPQHLFESFVPTQAPPTLLVEGSTWQEGRSQSSVEEPLCNRVASRCHNSDSDSDCRVYQAPPHGHRVHMKPFYLRSFIDKDHGTQELNSLPKMTQKALEILQRTTPERKMVTIWPGVQVPRSRTKR